MSGNAIGAGSGGRPGATPLGAVFGGLFSRLLGAALDDEDRRRVFEAKMRALKTGPSGVPVAWRNPASGHYGSIVPGPAYQAGGTYCREYTQAVFVDSTTPRLARGTACRKPDGSWSIVR